MKVLIALFPAVTHVYPVLPLAWALQAAGHEVRMASHAGIWDADPMGAITAAGLTGVPLGTADEYPHRPATAGAEREQNRHSLLALEHPDAGDWASVRTNLAGLLSVYYPSDAPLGRPWPVLDALVGLARAGRPDLVLWDPSWSVGRPSTVRAAGRLRWRAMRSRPRTARPARGPRHGTFTASCYTPPSA